MSAISNPRTEFAAIVKKHNLYYPFCIVSAEYEVLGTKTPTTRRAEVYRLAGENNTRTDLFGLKVVETLRPNFMDPKAKDKNTSKKAYSLQEAIEALRKWEEESDHDPALQKQEGDYDLIWRPHYTIVAELFGIFVKSDTPKPKPKKFSL